MSYAAAHAFQFEDSDAVRCEAAWERWLFELFEVSKTRNSPTIVSRG